MTTLARTLDQPAGGAFADIQRLLDARYLAQSLDLHNRTRALAFLAGQHTATRRGRGLDFDEVRPYYAGDDVRSIDWRVTARTGDPHTKLFKEERERPVLVAVDQRNSLFFGSQTCFKSVTAAELAATFAWATLNNGDRLGGLIVGEQRHVELRPVASRKAVLSFIHRLCEVNQELPNRSERSEALSLDQQLLTLRRITRPGTHIILISDFADYQSEHHLPHLSHLSRHNRLTLCMVNDPLEEQAPHEGLYQFTDGQQISQLNTGNTDTRRRYQRLYLDRLEQLQSDCLLCKAPLIKAPTTQSVRSVLQPFFGGLS